MMRPESLSTLEKTTKNRTARKNEKQAPIYQVPDTYVYLHEGPRPLCVVFLFRHLLRFDWYSNTGK